MKKLFLSLMLAASTGLLISCSSGSSDDEGGGGGDNVDPFSGPTLSFSEYTEKYFDISGADFRSGGMPKSTTDTRKLEGLTMNTTMLANGANFIKIAGSNTYKELLIGIKGQSNYYSYKAQLINNSSSPFGGSDFNYSIPLSFGLDDIKGETLVIKGVFDDGEITKGIEQTFNFQTTPAIPAKDYSDKYFTITDAEYHTGSIPNKVSTNPKKLEGITLNDRVLANGSNLITIKGTQSYKEFLIGIEGISGYFSVKGTQGSSTFPGGGGGGSFPGGGGTFPTRADRADGDYTYVIPLMFGPEFGEDITIAVRGVLENGDQTEPFSERVKFEESMEGDLTVNLTFDQSKDLDLHMITPGGDHIYWDARRWKVTLPDGTEIEYGLDHDSNPACHIDGLNNENIVIPYGAIESGVYQIYLRMYENCDFSVGTDLNWTLLVRFQGQLLQNQIAQRSSDENAAFWNSGETTVESGGGYCDPVWGTYPYNHAGKINTYVMSFEVFPSGARGRVSGVRKCIYEPTFMDKIKQLDLEEGIH